MSKLDEARENLRLANEHYRICLKQFTEIQDKTVKAAHEVQVCNEAVIAALREEIDAVQGHR